jgi:hypothetical protein
MLSTYVGYNVTNQDNGMITCQVPMSLDLSYIKYFKNCMDELGQNPDYILPLESNWRNIKNKI